MDRIGAIKAVARGIGDLIVDTTPSAVTGSTIDADALIQPISKQLQGKDTYIYEGAGAGQRRTATDFEPANNRVLFAQGFTTTPSTNSKFIMLNHFDKDEYDNVVDRIIGVARMKHLVEKVATMELVATQYEYPCPSGFEYISTLRLVPSGWTDYGADDEVSRIFELPPRLFRVEPNAVGTYVIVIDRRKIDLNGFNEQWVNVLGQAKPEIQATDNATVPADLEEFVIAGASMLLAAQRISEGEEWKVKFRAFRELKNDLEAYVHTTRRGKRVG